jgi:hypothetical protein
MYRYAYRHTQKKNIQTVQKCRNAGRQTVRRTERLMFNILYKQYMHILYILMAHTDRQTLRQTEQTNAERETDQQTDRQVVYKFCAKRFRAKLIEIKKFVTRTHANAEWLN